MIASDWLVNSNETYFAILTMKSAAAFRIVLITAPDLKTARRLVRAALAARLVACANLVPKIESHYRWQGKIESGTEVLLIFKTIKTRLAALEKLILARHPYDTPEFVALPLSVGSRNYLAWLAESCSEK
jgi:periplasmic divalent cation tolerance protein